MTDEDRTGDRRRRSRLAAPSGTVAADGAERSWFDDDDVDPPVDSGTGLITLAFLGSALRRDRRMRALLAVLGLLLGAALWVLNSPPSQASTTLLLTVGPEGQPGTAILTDQAMAQSRGVAAAAVRKLGLQESADSLLASYKAKVVTDRVLRIVVDAPTNQEAVRRANAVAAAFLTFRAEQLNEQQKLQFAALDDALASATSQVASLTSRIDQVTQQPTSKTQQADLTNLRGARDQAQRDLGVLTEQVQSAKAAAQTTTAAMVGQSDVLDSASPLPQSRLRPLILFSGAGFIFALFLGAGIAILRALVSDRVRRRDDTALALGAPVGLSIPSQRLRLWPAGRGSSRVANRDVQRIVSFIGAALPADTRRSTLAVVPVDDRRTAAKAVVSLAGSLARDGARVIVADLCEGTPAARLTGQAEPGYRTVQIDGAQIGMLVPATEEIAPVGPLSPVAAPDQAMPEARSTADWSSADVVLTLASLDPSLPSDHLRTWAADAVVVVTAGRSSWTKIHAVGEMIRLAGTRLVSAVLVGADKRDESLGVSRAPEARHPSARNASAEPDGGLRRQLSVSSGG